MTTMVVRSVRLEADGVRSFRLEKPCGTAVDSWEPGAHLEFTLPSGLIRHYSLCGDPADRSSYLVAVLDAPDGRGGSREFHGLAPGTHLEVRGPRNHFPLADADNYLFIAGGVGITPILAMARSVAKDGKGFRVAYGGRTRTSMAFADEVEGFGDAALLVPEDTHGRIDIAAELDGCPPGTHVFCCGPEPLLRAVEQLCTADDRIGGFHFERFAAAATAGASAPTTVGPAFEVELARTGVTLTVDDDSSILDKVLEVVPDQPWACREGFCGSCETPVLAGEPEHGDEVLSDDERAANTVMMICVGRSRSPRLVLDI